MTRRNVQPDDPPLSRCGKCGTRYNPYGHSACPVCNDDEEPCSSIDCTAPMCPSEEAAEAWSAWMSDEKTGPGYEP